MTYLSRGDSPALLTCRDGEKRVQRIAEDRRAFFSREHQRQQFLRAFIFVMVSIPRRNRRNASSSSPRTERSTKGIFELIRLSSLIDR